MTEEEEESRKSEREKWRKSRNVILLSCCTAVGHQMSVFTQL